MDICLQDRKNNTVLRNIFALQPFLTIILEDMLKCNMNFKKPLELNNKKCLLQAVKNTVYYSTL